MAFFYVDSDGSGAAAPYNSWATAAQDLNVAVAAMAAGDVCFAQGAAIDTVAAARTLASAGTVANPIRVYGVKNGTTNTGTSVVTSDMSVRGTDTLYNFDLTGGGNDLTFTGTCYYYNINFTIIDRFLLSTTDRNYGFDNCELTGVSFRLNGNHMIVTLNNCDMDFHLWPSNTNVGGMLEINGGVWSYSGNYLIRAPVQTYLCSINSVDLSGSSVTDIFQGGVSSDGRIVINNCKMPTSWTRITTVSSTNSVWNYKEIGCSSNTSAKGATTSYPDYVEECYFGTIELEQTIVRTGGADDGASGLFAYAMTPRANLTTESTDGLLSPWMEVWVAAGSNTITVYICNDSASTDYLEDEVWCEFYFPDAGDTAQHDQVYDPALPHLINSTTAVTDDAGSTWGSGGNNHQTMSATVNSGFEGYALVRLHLAKRQATPDTLYLDPIPVVT